MTAPTYDGVAEAFLASTSLEAKLAFAALPRAAWRPSPQPQPELRPGRPPELRAATERTKTPRPTQLVNASKRAQLFHVFFHHELQAAELFCWASLTFVHAPEALRLGWLRLALDETRHMRLLAEHLTTLGYRVGDFPVRDWFWERVPAATRAEAFLAVMGAGFEGGNLDHGARFADAFRLAGDARGAAIQEQIAHEEIAHVRFALTWLETLGSPIRHVRDLEALLPPPLSPMVMRGPAVAREARLAAGFGSDFVDELIAWQPREVGPGRG